MKNHAKIERTERVVDQVRVMRLENASLRVDVSPETGGRITSLFHKGLQREFLWRNTPLPLRRVPPGEAYDPHFYGGIDEVIPGDLPEPIAGLDCPDHGELWTQPLEATFEEDALLLRGRLPLWNLSYEKRIRLHPDAPQVDLDVCIVNLASERRFFLWKLHAAAIISPGDELICPAEQAVVADAQWSRWQSLAPFPWPFVDGKRADCIPVSDGTTDFLFLYGLKAGHVGLRSQTRGCELSIDFDPQVFPYLCYFASYGGFDGHTVAVLEPATAMPLSVNEAIRLGQCSSLEPGSSLRTRISIHAGALG